MPFEMFYHVNFQRVRGVCNDYLTTLGTNPFDAAFHLTSIGRAVEGAPRLGDEPVGADLPHLESAEPDPLNGVCGPAYPHTGKHLSSRLAFLIQDLVFSIFRIDLATAPAVHPR